VEPDGSVTRPVRLDVLICAMSGDEIAIVIASRTAQNKSFRRSINNLINMGECRGEDQFGSLGEGLSIECSPTENANCIAIS
jgi:hypothetical protein